MMMIRKLVKVNRQIR